MDINTELEFIVYTGIISFMGFEFSKRKLSLMFLIIALGVFVGWLIKIPFYGSEAIYTLMTFCGLIIAYYFTLRGSEGGGE